MKKAVSILIFAFVLAGCMAQSSEMVGLPSPHKQGGKPLMQALNERHSKRQYVEKDLNDQQLSDLLWAAYGINRQDGKRTAASANNKQEVDIYLATSKGVFFYNALENELKKISSDDLREQTGRQPFVKTAALNLIYVVNKNKASGNDDHSKLICGSICIGAISQNVYLYCASEGLGSVVRAMVDKDKLTGILKLNSSQEIVLTQTVGFVK